MLPVGEMVDIGNYQTELDADGNGGNFLVRKPTQGQARRVGFIVCLHARDFRRALVLLSQ